jgi:hypothetical protein
MKALLVSVLLIALPALGQQGGSDTQKMSAVDRCKANRGVDCETAEGLKEWLLQERTRQQAIRDGSRHRLPR